MTYYTIIGENPVALKTHVTKDMKEHNHKVNRLIELGYHCIMCDTYKKGSSIYIYKHYKLSL